MHTKYELAPPYPIFAPKVFLKLDGVVVMNTGDSLIALSMDLEDNHGAFGFGVGLYSPRVTHSISNVSTASSDDQMSYSSRENNLLDVHMLELDSHLENGLTVLAQFPAQSPPSAGLLRNSNGAPSMPKDATNTPDLRQPAARERHSSTGKENLMNKQLGSPKASTENSPHTSRTHRSLDVYSFEGFTPKKDQQGDSVASSADSVPSTPTGRAALRTTLGLACQQGAQVLNGTSGEISLQPHENMDSQSLEDPDIFEKPAGVLRLQTRESPGSTASPRVGSLMSPPDSFPFPKGLCFSPGYGKFEGGSSTCSSCMSSPIILQSDSQCFTYSVRRYIDCYSARPDSPVDVEGETLPHLGQQ